MSAPPQLLIQVGRPRSVLIIGDAFRIESRQEIPNLWERFWYWALLGWKWERLS
jgi:hypothetical protein